MARKAKRSRRTKPKRIVREKLRSPKFLVSVIILVTVFIFSMLLKNYLYNAPGFIIKEVELKGEDLEGSYLFRELSGMGMGENIFAINVRDVTSSLKNEYFEIKSIYIERVFPNKLTFYIDKRKAVALIDSRGYYPVDNDMVILRDVTRTMQEGLPIIRGIYISKKDIGKKETSPKLKKALMLLGELSKSSLLENHNISEIDAANSRNLSFYIDDGLEVKIGSERFGQRLKALKRTLAEPDIEPRDIRYIDLRFKDVVIKPK